MNTKKLLLLFCLCSGLSINTSASFLNQVLDWTIVCGGSYITPFLNAKPSALPKDFDLEKALTQTPRYIQELAYKQCIKQNVDPSQFSVVAVPDCSACIWNISLNSSGFSVQKLVAIDKKFFEPPYNCGQVMLAHEIGHMQHKHPQKGIIGFLVTPLVVQYVANKLYKPQSWSGSIAYALLKLGAIKTIGLFTLGKLAEHQADGNSIKYCQGPIALRNTARFLRTNYYQENYVLPAQLCKQEWDTSMEQARCVPAPLKKLLINALSSKLILKWKLLTNSHPHPFARAQRFDEAAEKIESQKSLN